MYNIYIYRERERFVHIHVKDKGTFGAVPLTYFYLPKSVRAYLFAQSVEIQNFCSSPISVDPICPQPRNVLGFCMRSPPFRRSCSGLS